MQYLFLADCSCSDFVNSKGYGNLCIRKILRHIKFNYKVNNIFLSTSNPIAFHLYEKNGFIKLNNKLADKYNKKYNEFLLVYNFL